MSRKHNTRHRRARSGYARKRKALQADRYGTFHEGKPETRERLVAWVQPV